MRIARHLTLLLALLAGCDRATAPEPVAPLPSTLRLHATAEGVVGELIISCFVDWHVKIEARGSHYRGTAGGDAYRSALDGTGAGVVFWADAFTEFRMDVGPTGAVSIISLWEGEPAPPVSDSRFWEEVRTWAGVRGTGETVASGTWTCAPMDAHDDLVGHVTGTWTLTPY